MVLFKIFDENLKNALEEISVCGLHAFVEKIRKDHINFRKKSFIRNPVPFYQFHPAFCSPGCVDLVDLDAAVGDFP